MNKPIVLQLSTVIDNWHIHGCQILVGIKFCIKHKAAFTKINLFLITYTYNAVPRQIFIPLNQSGHSKMSPNFQKRHQFFFNFNQFNNCPFFLPKYFILLFSCLESKAAKQSHKFCLSVGLYDGALSNIFITVPSVFVYLSVFTRSYVFNLKRYILLCK